MSLIELAEWARGLGKDPALARQKAQRGTVPAVKIGRGWMIEESTPWNAMSLSFVKIHVADTFFSMTYAGERIICKKYKDKDEIEQISNFITSVMQCNVIKVKCDLYEENKLNALEDTLRRYYDAVNISYLDEPIMPGVDNQGILFKGEYLHYDQVVKVLYKDSRSFTDILKDNNIVYEELPIVNVNVVRFTYGGKMIYACSKSLIVSNTIFCTDVYPADGDWERLIIDVRNQSQQFKEPMKMSSKAKAIIEKAIEMMGKGVEENGGSPHVVTEKELLILKDKIYELGFSIGDLMKMDHHDVEETFLKKIMNSEYII